jgi:hypothetical protein
MILILAILKTTRPRSQPEACTEPPPSSPLEPRRGILKHLELSARQDRVETLAIGSHKQIHMEKFRIGGSFSKANTTKC